MAPASTSAPPALSPAELSYLHTSLSLTPPIRPDARSPTTFRPLVAETYLLPACNGSARLCFADGTEALVGVKAEVEKTPQRNAGKGFEGFDEDVQMVEADGGTNRRGEAKWVEITVDIPGQRDDDPLVVFLGAMIHEALVADEALPKRLWLGERWHWKLYIDILLLSPLPPSASYPLPLLSLTTHLALLSSALPAPISSEDEDPLFNDDWDSAISLYPPSTASSTSAPLGSKPPITLLITSVGPNIFFDPSASELRVADAVLAVSVTRTQDQIQVLAMRTIDSPAKLASAAEGVEGGLDCKDERGVWRPPRGGMKRDTIRNMLKLVTERGGVADEVLDGLEALETG